MRGQPIYVKDLASFIKHTIDSDKLVGKITISHAGSSDSASRKDIAFHIKNHIKSSSEITGVSNDTFNLAANRSAREYIGLQNTEMTWGYAFKRWEVMLTQCLKDKY